MKHSSKILLIEIGIILSSLFCIFLFNINYYIYLGFLSALAITLYFVLKKEKRRKERFHADIFLIIIISTLFYYSVTNFIGFFTGFYYSNYSKNLLGILTNIITSLIVIFSVESIRENLIKNIAYNKKMFFLIPIICLLLELPSIINFSLYETNYDIFNVFLTLIVPCFVKNIALTYILYKSDKTNSILYQLIMTIPNFFLPVFPNLGDFFSIIANVLLPVIVIVITANVTITKFEKIENSRKLANNKFFLYGTNSIIILILLSTLYLTSDMFRYTTLAIGSGSMSKTINKGDIVIIDKNYKDIKKKDIIAFQESGRILVHRVTKIHENNKYKTKGDANNDEDKWIVMEDNIKGKVVFKIKWVGWPTIALSELLK